MTRQGIRKTLLLISFLLFPITIYYLSPALIIQGAAEGIAVGSFVVFGLMFISSLILGRALRVGMPRGRTPRVLPHGGRQED